MNVGDWEESMSRHHQKIKLVNAINIFTTYSFIFNAEIKADFYRKKTVVSKWLIFNMRFNAHHHPSAHLWRQDVTPHRICDAKMWCLSASVTPRRDAWPFQLGFSESFQQFWAIQFAHGFPKLNLQNPKFLFQFSEIALVH